MRMTIRPPGREPYEMTLDQLTAHVRAARILKQMTTRDELKKKRLQAMGVVGSQMDASSAMYDRVIEHGAKVDEARQAAEVAHMGALDEQIADLTEMADDMSEFEQNAAPTSKTGAQSSVATTKPAAGIAKPSSISEALANLNSAQPNPKGWSDGDAYVGTNPPTR